MRIAHNAYIRMKTILVLNFGKKRGQTRQTPFLIAENRGIHSGFFATVHRSGTRGIDEFPFQRRHSEIQDQSIGMTARLKVRSQLRKVSTDNSAIRLQLHNDGGIDDKIQSVFTNQLGAIPDLDLLLTLDGHSAVSQFRGQRPAINAFQESRSERLMNQSCSFDDSVCRILVVIHATTIAFVVPCLAYDDVIRYTRFVLCLP